MVFDIWVTDGDGNIIPFERVIWEDKE